MRIKDSLSIRTKTMEKFTPELIHKSPKQIYLFPKIFSEQLHALWLTFRDVMARRLCLFLFHSSSLAVSSPPNQFFLCFAIFSAVFSHGLELENKIIWSEARESSARSQYLTVLILRSKISCAESGFVSKLFSFSWLDISKQGN